MKPLLALSMAVVMLLGCPHDASQKNSKNSESTRRKQKVYEAMSQAQDRAEQALGEAEQAYNRAVRSAKEVKEQVVREASDAHQAAQELVADAKRAVNVRDSVQRKADEMVSVVEKALGVESPRAEAPQRGKDSGEVATP
jgi:hypothetical protein